MKARDVKAHLDAQVGTRAMEGFVSDEPKSETRARAWSRYYAEVSEMKDGEQVTKKLEGEIMKLFPAEVEEKAEEAGSE